MQVNEIEQEIRHSNIGIIEVKEEPKTGDFTERDRLIAGKQILLGLAILFVFTEIIYQLNPINGSILLEICKTVFPPLATLIIAFYFKDKTDL